MHIWFREEMGGNKVYREVTLGMAVSVGSLDSVNEYFRGYVLPMS